MSDSLIDRGGEPINSDSILARLSKEAQQAIDAQVHEWFTQEHEETEHHD